MTWHWEPDTDIPVISLPYLLKANPCPCGFYGDSKRQCRCSVRQIENYRQRISGPLLDWIDIHVEVPLVDFRELTSDAITDPPQ